MNDTDMLNSMQTNIDVAYELAAAGKFQDAVSHFQFVRALIRPSLDQTHLRRVTAGHFASLENESKMYRELLMKQKQEWETEVVIASDSLGLPRTDEKKGPLSGLESTFPYMVDQNLPNARVQSYARRYHVSDDIVKLLEKDREIGTDAYFVYHIGLNDCARRMFLEEDRIALGQHTKSMRELVVGFAQKYRRQILTHLPSLQYVSKEDYALNLERIYQLLKMRNCRKLIVVTTILPPENFWAGTPYMAKFFAEYNLALYSFAWRTQTSIVDLDRLCWARLNENVLLEDGMHLAMAGHKLLADQICTQIV